MAGRVRVVVATTEGPSAVLRITTEDPSLRSVVCLDRTTTMLAISRAYDAFVRAPTGIVERAVGHPAFRIDVAAPIDDGDSWQLGFYLAHCLKSAGRLAEDDQPADLVLWATGRVDSDLAVHAVERLDDKLRRSAGLFSAAGPPLLAILPAVQADVQGVLPGTVGRLPVATVDPALQHLGLRPRPGRRIGLRAGGIAGLAAVIAASAAAVLWLPGAAPDAIRNVLGISHEAVAVRMLDAVYPVVQFDSLGVAIRDGDRVGRAVAHVALGVAADGRRQVLGVWVEPSAGATTWPSMVEDLRTRGVSDIVIAVADQADTLLEAVGRAYPQTTVLTGAVRLIRETTAAVSSKDRRAVAADLRSVYGAATSAEAAVALEDFEVKWGDRYPTVAPMWRAAWTTVETLLALPPEGRVLVTATGALDELHRTLQRAADAGFEDTGAARATLLQAALSSGVDGRRTAGWNATMAVLRARFGDRLPPAAP